MSQESASFRSWLDTHLERHIDRYTHSHETRNKHRATTSHGPTRLAEDLVSVCECESMCEPGCQLLSPYRKARKEELFLLCRSTTLSPLCLLPYQSVVSLRSAASGFKLGRLPGGSV